MRTPTRLSLNRIRDIADAVEANRELTAMDVINDPALNPNNVSYSTINRALNREGLKSRAAKERFALNVTHKFNRYQFALFHERWIVNDWAEVVFSNESNLFPVKRGRSLSVEIDLTLPKNYTIQIQPWHGVLELLAWGDIRYDGVGPYFELKA